MLTVSIGRIGWGAERVRSLQIPRKISWAGVELWVHVEGSVQMAVGMNRTVICRGNYCAGIIGEKRWRIENRFERDVRLASE